MKKRIYFKIEKCRDLFFQKVLISYNLNNWNELVLKFNIPRSMLSKYRDGSLTIPKKIYEDLIKNLNENDEEYFSNNILFLDENWGRIKGGNSTYLKHKDILIKISQSMDTFASMYYYWEEIDS